MHYYDDASRDGKNTIFAMEYEYSHAIIYGAG